MKPLLSIFLPICLLPLALSCERQDRMGTEADAPVRFSLSTKALLPGETTYRAALLRPASYAVVSTGTYCDEVEDHDETAGYSWLSPCRVDADGLPLLSDGTVTTDVGLADHNSSYGLRYGTGGAYYLVVAAPARALTSGYWPWTPEREFYVSDAQTVSLAGSWLDGSYVYESSSVEALTLKDRRARFSIHIECGELEEAYLQSVTLRNRVNTARWYPGQGFSVDNYTTEDLAYYDCGGSPMHLVRADGDTWNSSDALVSAVPEVFLPALDYSDAAFTALRPQIEVLLGDDPSHPVAARIFITENVLPMKNYTYNIYISKYNVTVSLTASDWEDGGDLDVLGDESTALLGTFDLGGWTDGGNLGTDDWNTSF